MQSTSNCFVEPPIVPKCVIDEGAAKLTALPHEADTFWRSELRLARCVVSGGSVMRNKHRNKDLAFTYRERQVLGIQGLIPLAVQTIDQQIERCRLRFETLQNHMQRYHFLSEIECRNRKLFYRLLLSAPNTYLPVLDSSASDFLVKNHSLLYMHARGLYITIKDQGHVYDVMRNWPFRSVRCVLVTDGAQVMSMGDYGANAMVVLWSKLLQHTVLGGMHPDFCLAVLLDVGTDNTELLDDEMYVGLPKRRLAACPKYEEFFEEFVQAVLRLYGPRCIIQCKDFETINAVRLLERHTRWQAFMNIDLQCLAGCCLAGVLGARPLTRKEFVENMFLFYGADITNVGMARLCLAQLKHLGLSEVDAKARIWFADKWGLVVRHRPKHKVPEVLLEFAQAHRPMRHLANIIDCVQPNILVGGCSQPNAFTKDVLNAMARSSERPIIFAMSRPLERAECTADDAFVHTKGRCIFISGSALPPVKYANKWYQPGHCSSVHMLAGITLGIMLAGMTNVPDELFFVAAERLSDLVWPNDLEKRDVYPPLKKVQCVNLKIAEAIFLFAYQRKLATQWPQPQNPMEFIKDHMYYAVYRDEAKAVKCLEEYVIGTTESRRYYKEKI